MLKEDLECRLVHHASDKCAFVRANCADEEAGIFSYLSLYYCRLPHLQPLAFVILALWLGLLFSTIGIAASDFFCVNLSTISTLLGMSESMAGVTFLAFGNGSPDVFSTFAAMKTNSGSLAIGELIGAAGFITAVVAGSMALVRPFRVARRSFVRDVGFFIVAASFSMVFLWDGKLYLWECATMVAFYVFYVAFVMVWHWWLARTRYRKLREAAIRSHYILPGGEEEEIRSEYRDEDDVNNASRATTPLAGVSNEDFLTLEQGGEERVSSDMEDDETRERWLGELNSNMRLSRPGLGSRRNTQNPIRPSLVGALEFRAVLSSLKKSRNIQSIPINLRRYSDDPTFTTAQQQDFLPAPNSAGALPSHLLPPGDTQQRPSGTGQTLDPNWTVGGRARAVSTNDLGNTRLDPGAFGRPEFIGIHGTSSIDIGSASHDGAISPTQPELRSRTATPPLITTRSPSPDLLAPPQASVHGSQSTRPLSSGSSAGVESAQTPHRSYPKLAVPGSSPSIPFPPYTDDPLSTRTSSRAPSIRLPSPSASPEPFFHDEPYMESDDLSKMPRWWPYQLVPAPGILLATLFPTLAHWKKKGFWERLLGVVAAPSVFLLTITLPVVETPRDEPKEVEGTSQNFSLPGPVTPISSRGDFGHGGSVTILEPEDPLEGHSVEGNSAREGTGNRKSLSSYADAQRRSTASSQDSFGANSLPLSRNGGLLASPEQLPSSPQQSDEPKQWNRWLVITQAFTAPFFIVLVIWANTEPESPRALLRPTMYSMIFSLAMLAILISTTSPTRPPRWRVLLCFLGFVVSISWISTIAGEVVGVLKTIGVILDMSDAILGLTIFAVGNSLGDLVADITVARLGFPVMALSACFGGPMLNILLGIGLSGCYLTIKGGQHRHEHHPDRPYKFKPYHIDVSTTLVISGATLLVTLVGLLTVVPMRKWKMDRKIGWGLVAVWAASTVANVVVEGLGWSG